MFVVENEKAVKRAVVTVKSILANDREVEVRKGLIGGEDLIVSPPVKPQPPVALVQQASAPQRPSGIVNEHVVERRALNR